MLNESRRGKLRGLEGLFRKYCTMLTPPLYTIDGKTTCSCLGLEVRWARLVVEGWGRGIRTLSATCTLAWLDPVYFAVVLEEQ